MANKLQINRGTTYSISYTYLVDGVATSLVGATVRFTIKEDEFDSDLTDSDALVLKNITTGNAQGQATITLDPVDTQQIVPSKKYYFDIKVDLDSDGATVYKTAEGIVALDGSPTNRLT